METTNIPDLFRWESPSPLREQDSQVDRLTGFWFQSDRDGDGLGDNCDTNRDDDNDGVDDMIDNCRGIPNPDQIDNDKDEKGKQLHVHTTDINHRHSLFVGNDCETTLFNKLKPVKRVLIAWVLCFIAGDACDNDDDDDGVLDREDNCQLVPNPTQRDLNGQYNFYVLENKYFVLCFDVSIRPEESQKLRR